LSLPTGGVDVVIVGSYPPPHGGQSVHVRNLAMYGATHQLRTAVLNTGKSKQIVVPNVTSVGSAAQLAWVLMQLPRPGLVHVHVSTSADIGKVGPVAAVGWLRHIPWLITIHSGRSVQELQDGSLVGRQAAILLR
jgi:hypothetical protein